MGHSAVGPGSAGTVEGIGCWRERRERGSIRSAASPHTRLAQYDGLSAVLSLVPSLRATAMILIGQYDSPFVRRVAIALKLYELPYEHWPWSTFGDADKLATYNPLRRVPTLVLHSGEVLIESMAILDYLDEWVGPGKAMIAARGPDRR